MLHSSSLFRIANMLENWHQMDGNWLETINSYVQCAYEIVTISWFSMKLGMINSFLIVCFTVVQKIFFKYRFLTKIQSKAIEQHLQENALLLQ